MKILTPKEYILENPANYDEVRFRLHYRGTRTVHNVQDLYHARSKLFLSFFQNKEHRTVALDIFRYVVDTTDEDNEDLIMEKFVFALYDAGFFG